jgi:hypothetical protein
MNESFYSVLPVLIQLNFEVIKNLGTGFAFDILFTHVLLKIKVMKKYLTTAILLAMFTTCTTLMAQNHRDDYLGLPGDNLNLYAVMKLFQESETLESFERNLNDQNTRINNLDLNGDNFIDYIRVTDYVDRDVHNIVLQVAINNRENQDVAVFTVQRFQNGQVQIQLIGDEALYGRNYIIEPIYDDQYANQTANPGYTGYPAGNVTVVRTNYYEIASWPVIRFIFMPNYVVWHSDWHWGYYPPYWHSWQPCYWHYYSGYHYNWYNDYYGHYHRCDYARYDHWNDFYYSNRRSHSPYVSHRIESGHYKGTYSHPDQWKKGEELYARTNHDQGNRREVHNTDNVTARRTGTQAQTAQPKGNSFSTSRRTNTDAARPVVKSVSANNSGSERRQANTFSGRSATTAPASHNSGNGRKTTNTFSERSTTSKVTSHNSGTERKYAANGSAKPDNQKVTAYNSFSERRTATTANNRPSANSRPAQSASHSRSMNKPPAKAESFSSRRSSGTSQSAKTSKSTDTKKSNDTSKSSHRR